MAKRTYVLGDFPIATSVSGTNFLLIDKKTGLTIRSFTVSKYEMDHVRAYREGYVKALNSK